MEVERTHNTTLFHGTRSADERWNQARSDYRLQNEQSGTAVSNTRIQAPILDGRKTNRGCAVRQNWSSRQKVEFVDEVIQAINEGVAGSVTEYYRDVMKCVPAEVERLRNRFTKWSKADAYGRCLDDLLGRNKSSNGKKRQTRNTASPFHEIETELYSQFVEKRKKGQKVSSKWLQVNGRKIFNAKKLENVAKWGTTTFKASSGWMRRFIKRKKIKFRYTNLLFFATF